MRRFPFVLLFVALALAGSAALLIDYTVAAPVFCAEGGGCDALRQTSYAHPGGIPLPALAILAFLLVAVLSFARGPRVRQVNALVTGVGGVVGFGLIGLQLVLGHLCPYCAVVDTSAILLALLGANRLRQGWDPPSGALAALATSSVVAASLAGPFVWAAHEAKRIPPPVAHEIAETPPGLVTVVDFVDFECPFCRMTQAKLGPILAAHKDKVRLVRKMVPLTRIHPHALAAAKAACCGDELGKGDAMADALFATKVEDLTPDGCRKVAEQLGLPMAKYDACLASPELDVRLAKERLDFDRSARKGDGLPLLWIGPHKMMGAKEDSELAAALDDALAHAGS